MARIHDNIERLFGAGISEAALLEAFRLEHEAFVSHPMASADGDNVLVHGDFNTSSVECSHAGRFERYFYTTADGLIVHHRNIKVAERFLRQKIAFNHTSKLVRFYDSVGVQYVHLDAVGYGPIVWPQFGFELREPDDLKLLRDHFRSIVEAMGYEVEGMPLETPQLAIARLDGVDVGFDALERTYESLHRRPIPMILDLKRPKTRAFLEARGILDSRRTC